MKKRIKVHYNSPVILTFTAISLAALILNLITGGWSNRTLFSVYRASMLNPLTWLRLFTHVLGHVGYQHFIANMLMFLVVGPPMEETYGSKRLLLAILVTYMIEKPAARLMDRLRAKRQEKLTSSSPSA